MKDLHFSRDSLAVLGILIVALAARLWGIHFGLPYLYHADEPIVVNHALAFGTGDLNPHFFKIPPLVSYLLFVCYGIFYAAGRGTGAFHSLQDFENLFFFAPTSFYLIARVIFGALLGTVSVYALYRLAKRFWDTRMALWASFFLALNFLHVRDSHYVYADIPLVLALLAGFFVILRITEADRSSKSFDGSVALHLCAGGMIGLAAATKYNGIFLAMPYLWICLRTVPWNRWLGCWALAGLAAFVVFVILNPFSVLDDSFFLKELTEQSGSNQGGFPWFHHLTYSLAGALGWPMLVLAILGGFRQLFSKDVRSQAIAVFVVGYYAVLCCFGQPYDRYVLPLVPFLLLLAAQFLLGLKIKDPLLFWILVPFAVLPSMIKTVHWDRLMSEPDVRTVAKEWVEAQLPAGSRLAMDGTFYMPRLAFTPLQLEAKKEQATRSGFQTAAKGRRIDALLEKPHEPSFELFFLSRAAGGPGFLFAEPRLPYDFNVLRQTGIQYVLLIDALHERGDPFYRDLQLNADRVMTFSPYRDAKDLTIHDPQTMTGGPFLWSDILPRERNGYPVSVYRIREAPAN